MQPYANSAGRGGARVKGDDASRSRGEWMTLPVPNRRKIDFAALLCEVKFVVGPRCSVARSNSNGGARCTVSVSGT